MDEIYAKADVIIYHIPLNETTKHIINKDNIVKMKDNVVIINVSRGGIMNAQDALEGIISGKISGIALDVYENEGEYFRSDWGERYIPDATLRDLLTHPKVIVTPHTAFFTDEAISNIVSMALENVKHYLDTGVVSNIVNK